MRAAMSSRGRGRRWECGKEGKPSRGSRPSPGGPPIPQPARAEETKLPPIEVCLQTTRFHGVRYCLASPGRAWRRKASPRFPRALSRPPSTAAAGMDGRSGTGFCGLPRRAGGARYGPAGISAAFGGALFADERGELVERPLRRHVANGRSMRVGFAGRLAPDVAVR